MTKRDCVFGLISFNDLEWSQHLAKVIDVSITGLGIESDKPFKPGLVSFKQCVCGNKFGLVVWCKEHDSGYRAGIEFISLARSEEDYIRKLVQQLPEGRIEDPKCLIKKLIKQHQQISAGHLTDLL